ncbi:mur ligase family, catalytic domain protein [Mycobacterium xenopi 3993]|nr:mur ligase family, catalytic domain protein [Mycobacterium xenopi 3993]
MSVACGTGDDERHLAATRAAPGAHGWHWGAGMSGIARILLDRGGMVSGSDAKESRGVRALRARAR